MNKIQRFLELVPDKSKVELEKDLKAFTTVKIGGKAEVWYEAKSSKEFVEILKIAQSINLPFTVIGMGSNILISDKGIRGLVIKASTKEISVLEKTGKSKNFKLLEARQEERQDTTKRYDFNDLDYSEEENERIKVKIDAGVVMAYANSYLINKGITGLQWYSGIPGNLGGWIFNNVHGGKHFISEMVESVEVLDQSGNIQILGKDLLEFDYDYSRFHHSGEIILSANLNMYLGDTRKAKYVSYEWTKRKHKFQPQRSIGCIFKNLEKETVEKYELNTSSVGNLIEHFLNLKGYRVGDAVISPLHHNFIENVGNATAKDYRQLINLIIEKADEIGIKLETEIIFLGEWE